MRKSKWSKLLCLVLACVLSVMLYGCPGGETPPGGSSTTTGGGGTVLPPDPEGTVYGNGEALEGAGYLCRLTSAIGVELADEVGNLNRLLQALSESNININYIYLSFNRDSGLPVMVFQTEDSAEVESCIRKKGFSVV